MKTTNITIPIKSENISHLKDPQGKGHDAFYAYVKVADLPLTLPTGVNPRSQNLQSRVSRQIQTGLIENEDVFHLLNRGLTITALDAKYNQKTEQLNLEMAGQMYGVLDGGHSYAIIRKNIEPYLKPPDEGETLERPEFMDAFVKIEVLKGIKSDLVIDLAQARNTSAQVRDESLANLEGTFDWLKETFKDTQFGKLIAYRENEDDNLFPLDVREVVALLTLFHPRFRESDNAPTLGYASKGRSLQLFRDEPDGYKVLRNIAVDIVQLYDYIHLRFADMYQELGGLMGIGESDKRKSKQVKLAKVTGVKTFDEGFDLYYLGQKATYQFPDGLLYPILAAMRGIVGYRSDVARFKAKPQPFFDGMARSLVKATLEMFKENNRNANAVGKSVSHWQNLHEKVINTYLRKVSPDTERDVT